MTFTEIGAQTGYHPATISKWWRDGGPPAPVVDRGRCRSIGVIEGTLRNCFGKARRARAAGTSVTADERAGNAEFRAENAQLRMESDLLKQPLASG